MKTQQHSLSIRDWPGGTENELKKTRRENLCATPRLHVTRADARCSKPIAHAKQRATTVHVKNCNDCHARARWLVLTRTCTNLHVLTKNARMYARFASANSRANAHDPLDPCRTHTAAHRNNLLQEDMTRANDAWRIDSTNFHRVLRSANEFDAEASA